MRNLPVLLTVVFLAIALPLYASEPEVLFSCGLRTSTVDDAAPVFAVTGRFEDYSIHAQARGKSALTLSFSALYIPKNTFSIDLLSYNVIRYNEGQYHLASLSLGQRFTPGCFTLAYEAGLQGGMNLPTASPPQFTLSPLLRFEAGLNVFDSLTIGLVLSGGNERESSLQSTPLVSPYLSFEAGSFVARLDADFRYVNLSNDRPFPLGSFMTLFSFGYKGKAK